MKLRFVLLLVATATITLAQNKRRDDLKKPLVLAGQGSFFVGGESKPLAQGGEVTINQMYVQYQVPPDGDRHVPVVGRAFGLADHRDDALDRCELARRRFRGPSRSEDAERENDDAYTHSASLALKTRSRC